MEDLLKLYYSVSMKEDTLLKTETSNLKKKKKKKSLKFCSENETPRLNIRHWI